ncbi:MAG TPA: hypothetical protein VKZ84_08145 [Bacteriovoracaceae bacterium]|nr:hypothetical protein [Bacteriovoracaceae bacterium]
MKFFALTLAFVSFSAFATNCFTRLDSDLGLNLSQEICLNSVQVIGGVAHVDVSFDGFQKVKRIVVGQGIKKSNGVSYKLEDLEAIYTSEQTYCSRAFEGHVHAQITLTSHALVVDKVYGEFIEKGDYCHDEGQVTGIIRYTQN